MTCWIEDEFHLEQHSVLLSKHGLVADAALNKWTRESVKRTGLRSCSVYCAEDIHVTVAFITSRIAASSAPGHVAGQFRQHHLRIVTKTEPAHEVTPEMYPNRIHHGADAEHGEGLTAWLVYFREIKVKENDEEQDPSVPITEGPAAQAPDD